jgi:hypothetical protein
LKVNLHDQFLEGWAGVIPPGYSATRQHATSRRGFHSSAADAGRSVRRHNTAGALLRAVSRRDWALGAKAVG